jgi:type I restriction enzyme R subunit
VDDAVDQYRFDRDPVVKHLRSGQGRNVEPLLGFPSGALVHFAVSHQHVRMSTRLAGADTVFLPFDRGDGGAAGNPPNPQGHRTAYLWREVWARDSWLEIIGRYLLAQRDDKKRLKAIIYPRHHQLDATRQLLAAVLHDGPGGKYLIQHSAGSGKTNSIAWAAHFLADLHDALHRKLFDTVLVVNHERHQGIDIVPIPRVGKRLQHFRGHFRNRRLHDGAPPTGLYKEIQSTDARIGWLRELGRAAPARRGPARRR